MPDKTATRNSRSKPSIGRRRTADRTSKISDTADKDRSPTPSSTTVPAWQLFAGALLQYHALLRRVGGLPPRDFAGLVIDDTEVDRLLFSLPGLDGPAPEQLAPTIERLSPQLEKLRAQLQSAGEQDSEDQLYRIARFAGISGPALETLAFLASVELSPQMQRLLAYLQDNVSATRPWLTTLSELLPGVDPGSATVAPDSALNRAALIEIDESGPWATRAVRLHERVAWAINGNDSPDSAMPKQRTVIEALESRAKQNRLTVITGADRQSRLQMAIPETVGARFIVVQEPKDDSTWQAVVREATVSGSSVVTEVDEELKVDSAYWMDRASHLPFVISTHDEQPLERMPERSWKELHVADGIAPNAEWRDQLGIDQVTGHRLNRDQLRLVARAQAANPGDVNAAVRRLASGHLDRLALQVRPSRGWEDLVLPPREMSQLKELTERYRHGPTVYGEWGFKPVPSTGIVTLFAGASGTGKTLAAEVIAAELQLDVYKIDLSTVVSKYIGETEKNLEKIFDAASAGNMVLFFDEADALFGKRSDVSDAHDRYANIEVSYLLQRLETYDGLVVLATNLQGNMDQAFLRRIHVSVDFPMPSEKERLRIWQLSFPDQAPTESLDLEFLAQQFRISGGNIRNATLTAAFLAASQGSQIEMKHVVHGLQRELEKLGRLINPEDFGRYHSLTGGK